jgi:hypothetical protein
MTTKKFINCTLQEIQRLCTLAQYSDVEPAKESKPTALQVAPYDTLDSLTP